MEGLHSFPSDRHYRPDASHGTLPPVLSSLKSSDDDIEDFSALSLSDAPLMPHIIPCIECTLYFSLTYVLDTYFTTGTAVGSGDSVLSVS